MEIILIGQESSKRTDFFKKAAYELGHNIKLLSWDNLEKKQLDNAKIIKIDPRTYTESNIALLPEIVQKYKHQLQTLDKLPGTIYLNKPSQIAKTLDKIECKRILNANDIPTTPMLQWNVGCIDDLRLMVKNNKIYDVFIKPRYGSGAAGILVYRYCPKINEEIIYTSAAINKCGDIYNTKKIRKIKDKEEIAKITNLLLKQQVILEKWIPKAKYKGLSYDLRVVCQYGKVEFIVARGSKTPVTNLHLNNGAIELNAIDLSENTKKNIENLCIKTMECFPGLNAAGIDILMTPRGKLMVIEVNGQGDLIYQDIFNENNIYKSQMIGMIEEYESVNK